MIFGKIENLTVLCFDEDTDPDSFGERIHESVNSYPAGCLVMVDILGGTPFNQLMLANPEMNFSAVCGANLNMLLEVLVSREGSTAEELARKAIAVGRESIIDVNAMLSKN